MCSTSLPACLCTLLLLVTVPALQHTRKNSLAVKFHQLLKAQLPSETVQRQPRHCCDMQAKHNMLHMSKLALHVHVHIPVQRMARQLSQVHTLIPQHAYSW
jgi:hypothetical protein